VHWPRACTRLPTDALGEQAHLAYSHQSPRNHGARRAPAPASLPPCINRGTPSGGHAPQWTRKQRAAGRAPSPVLQERPPWPTSCAIAGPGASSACAAAEASVPPCWQQPPSDSSVPASCACSAHFFFESAGIDPVTQTQKRLLLLLPVR